MWGRCPRWGWLLFIAFANLAIWLGLTLAVANLASDGVNLGIETMVRRGEATAVAYLQQPDGLRDVAPGMAPANATAEVVDDGRGEIAPRQTAEIVAWGQQATPTVSAAAPLPTATGSPVIAGAATAPAPAKPGATAAASLAGQPVVLSDPGFADLMQAGSTLDVAARGQRIRIDYDEATLNHEIAALLAQNGDLPYRNVWVSLRPDSVLVTGDVTVIGLPIKAELLGTLLVEDCALRMNVEALSMGGLLTPRFMKSQASAIALDALDWYPSDSPVCLDEVVLGVGGLTVYGHRR